MKVNNSTSLDIRSLFSFFRDIRHYDLTKLKADLLAGLTVAIVALPQTMAYAIIAGVHPKYGLYAAIIPVIISSLFGSSKFLIAGPTNAISMLIFSTVSTVAIGGTAISALPEEQKMTIILFLAILVGLIQIAMGLVKAGNLVNFISHSVIIGFTAGAGVLIAFNQLKNFFGLSISSSPDFVHNFVNVIRNIASLNLASTILGFFTIMFIVFTRKISQRLPAPFLAMAISAIVAWFFNLGQYGVKLIGEIPQSLPPFAVPDFNFGLAQQLIMPALALAILAIVEALSIAKSIASSSGERINGNQEFIGQGLANLVGGFFSAIPGTGSFTRSAVNYKSGARTRFAGVYSGLIIGLIVLFLAPLAKYIPIPSLAGILMVIAYTMIDQKSLKISYRATTADKIVLLTTFFSTIFLELEKAVFIGVIISIILFLKKVSRPQIYRMYPQAHDNKLRPVDHNAKECPQIAIYEIQGPLFFGAVSELEDQLYKLDHKHIKVIVIRMKFIQLLDATGVHAFEKLLEDLENKKIKLILTGVNEGVMRVFKRTGLFEKIGEENIAPDTTWAVHYAIKNYIEPERCQNCPVKVFKECQK